MHNLLTHNAEVNFPCKFYCKYGFGWNQKRFYNSISSSWISIQSFFHVRLQHETKISRRRVDVLEANLSLNLHAHSHAPSRPSISFWGCLSSGGQKPRFDVSTEWKLFNVFIVVRSFYQFRHHQQNNEISPSRFLLSVQAKELFSLFFLTRHWNCVELLFVWTLLSGSTFIGMTEKKNCETRRFSEHTQRSLVWEAFVQHESRKQTKKKLLSMARGKGSEMSGNFFSFFRQFSSCSSVNKQNNINFPWIQLLGNMWKSRN